jgi:hypothetical protein
MPSACPRRRSCARRQDPVTRRPLLDRGCPSPSRTGPPRRAGTGPLLNDPAYLDRVRELRANVPLMTSVCTGSLVYAAAGLLIGRKATTHWASLNLLSDLDPTIITDVSSHASSTTATSSPAPASAPASTWPFTS